MKNYLYYPNMEPPTSEWLKFSILYLDKLESIVPYHRQHLVSGEYRRLREETDLVDFFSPTYSQGVDATTTAIQETEQMLRRTYSSAHYFNTINLKRDWKNPRSWDYQVYNEKFSFPWKEFCEEQKIGRINDDGMMLPKGLALLYMTHLAKRIANEKDLSIITDDLEYDKYINYSFIRTTNTDNRERFMRGTINLQAPGDIRSVPLDKLIDFRNKNRELIKAFNNQIDLVEESIGKGLLEEQFVDDFNYTQKDLKAAIGGLVKDVVLVPFGFYTLVQNSQAMLPDYIKELLGGIGAIVSGVYSVRKSLRSNREARMCKRYLVKLRKLK